MGRLMDFSDNKDGATIINDTSGLIPKHIVNQKELNEWEANNINNAVKKYLLKRKKIDFTVEWLKSVHHDMFDKTWEWAGKFRRNSFNKLGINWKNIQQQLKLLVDDIKYWETHPEEMTIIEQSVRIHHRLTKIHSFSNGNGRHARLVSDIFLFNKEQKLPKWPDKKLIEETDIRKKYISALQEADQGIYRVLEDFIIKLIPE